jgi:hypothetical protein
LIEANIYDPAYLENDFFIEYPVPFKQWVKKQSSSNRQKKSEALNVRQTYSTIKSQYPYLG